ncbi:type II inositol polyphosphate 5-phosphatase 15 isoform X2 [Daucus carota subsp. sativus]|uniref:type II inositol polyphosphate 5-phosphatase 15 isoform X2 n=1 Tax=Daucus carota subsp. sativus TaxID=79200 RepID=UPI0007EEFA2F|nr:PREDICTED: type II inositol polyphosphate 5-phosphatase 15-like isoform X1 [Daucus carota subsp. sativus]
MESGMDPPKIFDRFYDSSEEEQENEFLYTDTNTAGKRLDYMIQFLDRRLENHHRNSDPLPEFVAPGGGEGIFRLPVRAAVHPGRPPCLELRPHPLTETQLGCFLRNLVCVDDSELWVGSENGVRVWSLGDVYKPAREDVVVNGDQETAPFVQSVTVSPTLCLVGHDASRMVWSGHKDGRIRCWKMLADCRDGDRPRSFFKEVLSWQAHRTPVLSMVVTLYGDLWSGSEGGALTVWPLESIEKSLSFIPEERHMSALIVERSYIDLRSQVTGKGICCNIFSADVKYLLSDHSGENVWSAGYLSFALWDSRTRELLKAFNIDGQIENLSVAMDPTIEEEVRVKVLAGSKKEKSQSSISFFQRSRNALMGAADAVRRVAVRGAFGDDRKTEALITTIDGNIWTGCTNGSIVQWDGNGNRLQEFQYHSCPVQCLFAFGLRIWVGYASGLIDVLDLNGSKLGGWIAHSSPVIHMAVGAGFIFTLANHGGIRGWRITSPGPLDNVICKELGDREFLYTKLENVKILAGTWNVGQERATHDSLISWLGSAATGADIVVAGLQEVEMGAGFLAMSAAKESVGLEGSSVGQLWLDMIGKILDEGSTFQRIGYRQLAGLLIMVWVRNDIRSHVGDIDVAAVPCGFGRAIGNKGAVGLRMRVYDRILCFVNCHFAAHLEAVNRRNADFDHVYRTMIFSRPSNILNSASGMVKYLLLPCFIACIMYIVWLVYSSRLPLALSIAAGVSSSIQVLRGANVTGIEPVVGIPELSEADMVVFLGDFNYRLDGISYDEARDFISQRSFDWLRERDQLQAEMKSGNVFQGMREAVIGFPPTYKFEKHQPGLAGYDSGEKRRIPAWCDRILYRDNCSTTVSTCSLDCPVIASVLQYEACMDVTDSDHKPVRCIFNVEIARVDNSIRRQEFGEIMGSNEKIRHMLVEQNKVPETIVSTNNIILQNQDTSVLRITNKSGEDIALYEIVCEGEFTIHESGQLSSNHSFGSFGFPRWLQVSPTTGIVEPDHIAEIAVHHDEHQTLEEFVDGVPQNWWCEDARDKEVMLLIKVRGGCTTEIKSHRIRVRHSISGKKMPVERKPKNVNTQSSVLQRADFLGNSCTSDVFAHLQNLHTP